MPFSRSASAKCPSNTYGRTGASRPAPPASRGTTSDCNGSVGTEGDSESPPPQPPAVHGREQTWCCSWSSVITALLLLMLSAGPLRAPSLAKRVGEGAHHDR